jgi:hypothetical protein
VIGCAVLTRFSTGTNMKCMGTEGLTAAARILMLTCVCSIGLSLSSALRAASPADCAAEADRASRNQGTVAGGAGRGAVGGAAFGAIVGDSDSAKKGAAVGAVAGSARRGSQKNSTYNQVYDSCMRR